MATKTFAVSKDGWAIYDKFLSNAEGDGSIGAGKDYHLGFGESQAYYYRSFIQFTTDFTDVASITSAVLTLKSARSNDGTVNGYLRDEHGTFYATTMQVDRVTGSWSAGTAGNDELVSSGNALEWETMPSVTTTGRATASTPGTRPSSPTNLTVDITDIVRAWAPATVTGGGAATNYGIRLKSSEESISSTLPLSAGENSALGIDFAWYEFYSQEGGASGISGAVAPFITLTYTEITSTPPTDPEVPPEEGGGTGTLFPTVTPIKPSGVADGTSLARIVNLNDPQEWTSTSQYAMPEFSWSYTDGGGGACASWRLRIYSASTGGTTYFDSGVVTDAAHVGDTSVSLTPNATKPTWMPGAGWSSITGLVNGTVYYWQIQVTDAAGEENVAARKQFKVRWGQALYEFDAGASYDTTSGWSVARGFEPSGTQSTFIYQASGVKNTAVITGIAPSTPSAGTIEFTCSGGHSFVAGDVISIVGASPNGYNLSNQVVLSDGITATKFRITNAATGTYVSGGLVSEVAYQVATATVSNVTAAGGTVTYTTSAAHGFVAGQLVTITGVDPVAYNLANVRLATASGSTFTVTNAATGTFVSGGVATMHGRTGVMSSITNVSGSGTAVTYTSQNSFAAGQLVNISGITPAGYNNANALILTATASAFTVGANTTGAYVSGGSATAAISNVSSSISGHNRYLHAYLRMSSDDGSKPYVSNITFSYVDSIQLPDNWYGDPATTYFFLDQEIRRFGTKAVRVETVSASDASIIAYRQYEGDDINVVPSTTYTFSAYIKVGLLSGANNVRLIVQSGGGGTELANSGAHTTFQSDEEGWRRMSVTFTTGATTTSVRPLILLTNTADVVGNYFWADGVLFEEGTVVRSWTPGFVTSGVTFEGGGLNIDTSQGGKLRLKAGNGGPRDEITVGASGLEIGGSSGAVQVYSSASGQLDVSGNIVTSGTVNKLTITQPATSAALTIANGKTLTASNTLTFTGTDGSSVNVGSGGTMMTNPMSTAGDIIVGGASGSPTRLASVAGNLVLRSTGESTAPSYGSTFSASTITGNTNESGKDSLTVNGVLFASNIDSGIATVTPVANTSTGVAITGLSVSCTSSPATVADFSIMVTAEASAAALITTTWSTATFSGTTLTGFTARVVRSNTTSTTVNWLVIGR